MKLSKEDYKKLEDRVYNYPTTNKAGFVESEMEELLSHYKGINMDKFYDAMMGNTCMVAPDGQTIMYHCDIFNALLCGIENRDLNVFEWD